MTELSKSFHSQLVNFSLTSESIKIRRILLMIGADTRLVVSFVIGFHKRNYR